MVHGSGAGDAGRAGLADRGARRLADFQPGSMAAGAGMGTSAGTWGAASTGGVTAGAVPCCRHSAVSGLTGMVGVAVGPGGIGCTSAGSGRGAVNTDSSAVVIGIGRDSTGAGTLGTAVPAAGCVAAELAMRFDVAAGGAASPVEAAP
jgi:hypothetical protein